jgi:hypothetical protein
MPQAKPPSRERSVCSVPPPEDRTLAYSRAELQQLVEKSKGDGPASEDLTRQYAAEQWDQLRTRATHKSEIPVPAAGNPNATAAQAALSQVSSAKLKPNDTIPDADELTRVYVRPSVGGDASSSSAPPLDPLRHSASGLPIDDSSDENTSVGIRNRSLQRRADTLRAYRVFVGVAVAANILLWGAYLLERRGLVQVPNWWESWRTRAHHLYIEYVGPKPGAGTRDLQQ